MAYGLKTESYNNYLTEWAVKIYNQYLSDSNKKIKRTTLTSKIYVEPEKDEFEFLTHGSAVLVDDYSTIHTWYDTPRSEYRADGRFKDYKDFATINPELSAKLKDMKLRATSCPNVYCQQVADDGTYNKQKHYYWNNDRKTMVLMPDVYYVYDCADYDVYAYAGENTEDTKKNTKSTYDIYTTSTKAKTNKSINKWYEGSWNQYRAD
jgi:hypothetical protein